MAGNLVLWPSSGQLSGPSPQGDFASAIAGGLESFVAEPEIVPPEPTWVTQNKVALELSAVRLRDSSTTRRGSATLLCAPFALHRATIVDFAPDHSLIRVLQGAGIGRLFVTDWRSATADMRFWSIDDYLATLKVLVDQLGGAVNLIGL
jgi:poly(3-hydroxyalkanoate) synthetase